MSSPKRALSRDVRSAALARLGVSADAVHALPQVTPFLRRRLRMTLATAIGYLRASLQPEARALISLYDSTPFTRAERSKLTLEALCAAASISPSLALEMIGGAATRLDLQHAAFVASHAAGRVMKKTVDMALTDEGVHDRTLLHKITGMLPTPKGAQIAVNVVAQASSAAIAAPAPAAAPPPEQTIRRLADRFNETRGAAPAAPAALAPAAPPSPCDPIDAEFTSSDSDEEA